MSQLIPFQFDSKDVRVQIDDVGNPYWVLTDVCEILGLTNPREVAKRVEVGDVRKNDVIDALGRAQENWLVDEPALYEVIFRSNKPEAKRFRQWVFSEVLPQIRKTGSYQPHPKPTPLYEQYPQLRAIVELVEATAEARLIAEAAERKTETATELAQRALRTQDFLTIAEYVYMNGLQRQFPEHLHRDFGLFLSDYCQKHNIPARKASVALGKWEQELSYHVGTIEDTLPGWLRRFAQTNFHVIEGGHA
jgi:prophage antirepressor-like protein